MRRSANRDIVPFSIVIVFVAAALAGLVSAALADPDGFAVWKSSVLEGWRRNAEVNDQGFAVQILGRYDNHAAMNVYLTRNGLVELHESTTDVYVIQAGEAKLLLGGTIREPKTVDSGEIRGSSLEGGSRREMGPGEIVHIPANVPHQILVDPGETLSFIILKIEQ